MTSSFWSFGISPLSVIGGGCMLVGAVWLFILTMRGNSRSKGLLATELLKLLIIGLLVFTLFRPERIQRSRKTRQPLVAVLCDTSGSMQTQDVVVDGTPVQSRNAWLRQQVDMPFWSPLTTTYKIVVQDFGGDSSAATTDIDTAVRKPDDPGTDINQALENAIKENPDLRAVLLLSDGDWNTGKPPVSAATKLCIRDIPIFAVAVGSDRFLPDLELQSVSSPAYGLMDEHISLPFTIQSRLDRDVKTSVTLYGPDGVEATAPILVPAMSRFQDTLLFTPKKPGAFDFKLGIPVERDEVFADNNSKRFHMALRREVLKVLVIDSTPRWEYRFLHNALSRDPGVSVHCLLLHPGMAAGSGRDYIAAFPGSREAISKYDVVFLGDVGIGSEGLTTEDIDMLKGLVEQQGSGLVFLPGIAGRQASLADTPLAELMPVVMDESHINGFGFGMESHLDLTTRGRDHLLTMLASSPTANYAVWKGLPGFYWHAPVLRARPGTEVLAVHATARNQHGRLPLLVTGNYGNGKTLFMGTDSAWRWRRGVEDVYHYRFWGQVVRWMAHQRHMAHEQGIRLFFSPETPLRGQKVFLHATVFDQSGFPFSGGDVRVLLTSASGTTERLELSPEPGGWGVFTGAFVPREDGKYDLEVTCEAAGRKVQTKLMIAGQKRERVGQPARGDVLREIATITHGHHGTINDLDSMIENLQLLPEPKPMEVRFRLWCHPLWAGLIILLLGIYWMIRKLIGLV